MTTVTIEQLDEVYLRVFSDPSIEMELVDFFTYEYPGAKFTPQYKARIWDGKIRMLDPIRKTLYVGLASYVEEFCIRNGYQVVYKTPVHQTNNISYEEVEEYAHSLNLHGRGKPIDVRDYQIEAVQVALNKQRVVLLSATGSGKSLIIYTTMRWHLDKGHKCLIVTPTTSLVEQLYADFEDYSSANGWNTAENCSKIYSGFEKDPKRVTLTLEDGSKIYLLGSEFIKTLNRGMIEASNIKEGDDIDDRYIRNLQTR
jgi:ATP-dependent helicase YprA (DUF1998 family)